MVNYLEAKKILANGMIKPEVTILFAMSSNAEPLDLFLRAHAARRGIGLQTRLLPFGTLGQTLANTAPSQDRELFLLFPWDFVPELDWRSGVSTLTDLNKARQNLAETTRLLSARKTAGFCYVPAELPPVTHSRAELYALEGEISASAARLGASFLSSGDFALSPYLASGCPIAGAAQSSVAEVLLDRLAGPAAGGIKLICTDLDNTLWSGIVGEDGPDSVHADPEGAGYRHFLYQSLLRRLRASGTLLVAISRNDSDLAQLPLSQGRMPLCADDFIAIRADYELKSAKIASIAQSFNLGLEAIAFVDDNPVELAEVGSRLPEVTCLQFPEKVDALQALLAKLAYLCDRAVLTAEDTQRTEMYRRRLETAPPPTGEAGIEAFLRGMDMRLIIRDRSSQGWQRALQLINKTNQFNLNGERVSEDEFLGFIASGGRVFTAQLDDRSGTHGEILACLVDQAGMVHSLVLSCRVFERHVEHAFVIKLAEIIGKPALNFKYRSTLRNEPVKRFFADLAFTGNADVVHMNASAFAQSHCNVLTFFQIEEIAL